MEATILLWGIYIYVYILGLYRENGKEHGSDYLGL